LERFACMVWAVEEGVMNYDCIRGKRKKEKEWIET
jgi:hypothetical protein